MPTSPSILDLTIVIVYVVATTLLGAWFTRRQKDTRTYFVGDRNVSWWLVLISIVATETSTVTFLSIPGVGFEPGNPEKHVPPGNLTFLQLALGYVLGRFVIAGFLLPQYFRGELFSAYQLLRERFNPTVQRTASAVFLVTRTVVDGMRLWLTALLLQQFTGWDLRLSIVALGAVTIVYTYLGGMEAVIWTDLIQFVVYLLGAIVAGAVILRLLPGGWDDFVTINEAAGKFQVFDLDASLTNSRTIWAGLIGGAFVTMASHGADQNMVQRYFCARSLTAARTALVLSGFLVLAQFLLFLLIGLGLYALWREGVLAIPDGTRNDAVFGLFIRNHLPTGLIGLVTAAVLASAMASFSSSLNSAANAFVADFYRPLRPHHSETFYLRLSKAMTSFWGFAKVSVALLAIPLLDYLSREERRGIVDQVLAVAAVTTGILLGLFILGSLRRPVRSGAALVGFLAGFLASGSLWLASVSGQTLVAWPWLAPVGALTTTAVALSVNVFGGERAGRSDDRSPQPGFDAPG
jgi:SSS family solute:Na+ symporter